LLNFLQSEIEFVIAIAVSANCWPADMISDEHAELYPLEAQSSTALAISPVAAARSVAALLISYEHFVEPPPQSVTARDI
jgi:hypothetical protein